MEMDVKLDVPCVSASLPSPRRALSSLVCLCLYRAASTIADRERKILLRFLSPAAAADDVTRRRRRKRRNVNGSMCVYAETGGRVLVSGFLGWGRGGGRKGFLGIVRPPRLRIEIQNSRSRKQIERNTAEHLATRCPPFFPFPLPFLLPIPHSTRQVYSLHAYRCFPPSLPLYSTPLSSALP